MYDYLNFAKLIPTMVDDKRIKIASRARLPVNLLGYLKDNNVKIEGSINFYEDEEFHIVIIYGESDYALMVDLIDGKYTFCLFADSIMSNKYEYMEIFDRMFNSVKTILSYMYKDPQYEEKSFIKNTYRESFDLKIKDVCVYSLWAVFGDNFIEEYKLAFPEDTEIDAVIKVFDGYNA